MNRHSSNDKDRAVPSIRKTFAIQAGWFIDGLGGPPLKDRHITIAQGRVGTVTAAPPAGDPIQGALDFRHATVLPALMDAHVHLAFSGTLDMAVRQSQHKATPGQCRAAIDDHLACHRSHGVVAVRDGGDPWGAAMAARQSQVPFIKATCWGFHRAGRYGGIIGRPLDVAKLGDGSWTAPLAGADHVKLIQSGINRLDRFGHPGKPQFSQGQLHTIAGQTRRMGLPLMVHANGEEPVAMAVAAGCRSIEHGYFMGRDNLRQMADRGIFWVPTVTPMAALARQGAMNANQRLVARRTLGDQLDQIVYGRRHGVAMVLGTDAGALGVDHGRAVARELELFVVAGLSISQAVQCATDHAAQLMGLEKRGALRPGWSADFIAVPGPPEDLPENLNRVEVLYVGGRRIEFERNMV